MRTVVKHSYIQARSGNAKAKAIAHLNYIQHRSGHDKEQGGRLFFDKDRDELNGAEFRQGIKSAPRYGTVMHKFILSPGVQGVNLKEYTREIMEELGEVRGQDLQWQAVVHTNTEHDHVHVAVLGYDDRGGRVKFGKHDHEHARAVGDRYIERKHEFDRYYDRTLDRILGTEQPKREFDLDKLTDTYYRPEKEYEKKKGGKGSRTRESEPHDKYRTNLPVRRKGRKQRLVEARGRKDSDYFHDLYVSNTNRQRLEQLKEARPELSESIEQQLAAQDKHDAERRAQNAKQVAELERILGISSYEPKRNGAALKSAEKPQERDEKRTGLDIGADTPGSRSEQEQVLPFEEKKIPEKDKTEGSHERKKDEKLHEPDKEKTDEKEKEKEQEKQQQLRDQEIKERVLKEMEDIQVGFHLAQEMERHRIESERLLREKEEEERRLREEEERRRREEEERRQEMQSGDDEEY